MNSTSRCSLRSLIIRDGLKDIFSKEISRDLIGRLHARDLIGTGPRSPRRGAPYTFVTTEPDTHLVMHGSSSVPQHLQDLINASGGHMPQTYGVPVEEIERGIRMGVRKVNIDTDCRMQFMKDGLGMSADEMQAVFAEWNNTELNSYLVEITGEGDQQSCDHHEEDRGGPGPCHPCHVRSPFL